MSFYIFNFLPERLTCILKGLKGLKGLILEIISVFCDPLKFLDPLESGLKGRAAKKRKKKIER